MSSYGEYVERVATSMAAAEVLDHTLLWWDMRAQPQLGTLEIRVMDAQPSLDRVAGLATLVQGIARAAVEHPVTDDLPSEILAEDDFRAARYGLDARVVGSEGQARPLRALAEQTLALARAALRDDGLDGPLDVIAAMIGQPTEASRQRRVVGRGRIPALLRDLVARSDGGDTGR